MAGLRENHDELAATSAFLACRFFLSSFTCRLACRFFLGRFFLRCLFLRRRFLGLFLRCFLFGRGLFNWSLFLRGRFLGRWPAAAATTRWCRRGFPYGLRRGARAVFHDTGFFFLFFFLLKILFQRFAVGAAVAVLIGFIIPAPEGPIIEAHSSSCEFDGRRGLVRRGPGNKTTLANLH